MSDTGVVIESVMFRGNWVEVSFTEERDRGPKANKITTWQIEESFVSEELAYMKQAIIEFIDAAEVAKRNPPNAFHREEAGGEP